VNTKSQTTLRTWPSRTHSMALHGSRVTPVGLGRHGIQRMSMLTPCAKPHDATATLVYSAVPFVVFHVSAAPKEQVSKASPGGNVLGDLGNGIVIRAVPCL
jgi:hypothetical protein